MRRASVPTRQMPFSLPVLVATRMAQAAWKVKLRELTDERNCPVTTVRLLAAWDSPLIL